MYDELTMTSDGMNRSGTLRSNTIGMSIFLVILGVCILVSSGCGGEDTIWAAEARSPDGRWLASARTVENGGFGTGGIETDVDLKWMSSSKSPETVLVFVHDPRSQSKTIDISMKWITPSHLDVTYAGGARVDFQVVKYGDVDISLRDLSTTKNNSQ